MGGLLPCYWHRPMSIQPQAGAARSTNPPNWSHRLVFSGRTFLPTQRVDWGGLFLFRLANPIAPPNLPTPRTCPRGSNLMTSSAIPKRLLLAQKTRPLCFLTGPPRQSSPLQTRQMPGGLCFHPVNSLWKPPRLVRTPGVSGQHHPLRLATKPRIPWPFLLARALSCMRGPCLEQQLGSTPSKHPRRLRE